MNSNLAGFYDFCRDKKIAVCGVGISNSGVIELLQGHCRSLTVCDRKSAEQLGDEAAALQSRGISLILGERYLEDLDVDIIFRSPGMYFNQPELQQYIKKGVAVTSEAELFFELCPCPVYAITGTDGKTTTTSVLTEMLKKSGRSVYMGGNIGLPLLGLLERITPQDVAVVELSSFQLISMRHSPDTAAVTNIYPDHLNVHRDMNEYINAKRNILLHQNAFSRAVLNMDNAECAALCSDVRGELLYFSTKSVPERGAYLTADGWLCFTDGVCHERIMHRDDIKLPGMHNVENYLTAIAMAHGAVSAADMTAVAREFSGVEHRIEFVRELHGVRYYNDSIATSPASVSAGLNAFSQKMIIIAGGSDKKLDYSELSGIICRRVKLLILTGDTADRIEAAVRADRAFDKQAIKILRAQDMQQAVQLAYENARDGDIVSLSPASASFDKYKNFEQRGRDFKEIVKGLE